MAYTLIYDGIAAPSRGRKERNVTITMTLIENMCKAVATNAHLIARMADIPVSAGADAETVLARLLLTALFDGKYRPNPAVRFTEMAKAGRFDKIGDKEYDSRLNHVETIARTWKDRDLAKPIDIIRNAIETLDPGKDGPILTGNTPWNAPLRTEVPKDPDEAKQAANIEKLQAQAFAKAIEEAAWPPLNGFDDIDLDGCLDEEPSGNEEKASDGSIAEEWLPGDDPPDTPQGCGKDVPSSEGVAGPTGDLSSDTRASAGDADLPDDDSGDFPISAKAFARAAVESGGKRS